MSRPAAIAIAAHPDDIEFVMAGTLLLLGEAGYDLHYLTLASGSCGSFRCNALKTRAIRRRESKQAADILGARYHAPLVDDLEIFYDLRTLRRLAAVVREVQPRVALLPSPQDYMEDHTNSSRLAVTALFARAMPNFLTIPRRAVTEEPVTLYHAMPHGLVDSLGRAVVPEFFVNTGKTQGRKREALAAHRSQKEWLDHTQGLNSYLQTMDEMSRAVGKLSGRFEHAEGWRKHSHFGFCPEGADPLRDAVGAAYRRNRLYPK